LWVIDWRSSGSLRRMGRKTIFSVTAVAASLMAAAAVAAFF
jgi:hypothetical protein